MYAGEKSDRAIVLRRRPNKRRPLLAEAMERRAQPKGNNRQTAAVRTRSRVCTVIGHKGGGQRVQRKLIPSFQVGPISQKPLTTAQALESGTISKAATTPPKPSRPVNANDVAD